MLLAGFYLWTAQSSGNPYKFERESRGYYNLLTDGYLAGHLWMKVDPQVEQLKTAGAPGVGMHDASFYKGHFYLYFGSTPALVLFLPVKFLTGHHCPENLAVAIFCIAGLLLNAALAALLLRRLLPWAHPAWWLVGIIALGLGNMVGVLLRRAAFWEVPIASAYAFGSATLLCALLALTTRRTNLWLALAGTCYGFAIGSRPVYVFGAAGLLAVWWALAERRDGWRIRLDCETLARGVALFAPLGLLTGVILWHNHARFEDPFEFGMKWAMTGYDMLKWRMFDWANAPLNAWYYFWAPAHWSAYFPFVQPSGPAAIASTDNYYGQDNVYGLLPNLPLVIFAGAAWLLPQRHGIGPVRRFAIAFVALAGAMFVANTAVLLAFSAAAGRYMVDMAPYGALLGLIGWWTGAEALAGSTILRRLWQTGAAIALLVTAAFNFFLNFQSGRLFELQNPAGYARVSRFFNTVPALFERLQGYQPGRLELRVRFPKEKPSAYEPIVTTGWYYLGDILYVKYGLDGLIEFGFTHMNSPTITGAQVRIDYDAEHLLEIDLGSLYPPNAHPWFDGLLPQQAAGLKRRLSVRLNGAEVLAADTPFYESSPGDILIGRNPLGFIVEKQFTGQISQVRRLPVQPTVPSDPGTPGPVKYVLTFPTGKEGQAEPLVTTGVTGRGDVVYVQYAAPGLVLFGHDHWGNASAVSEPVAIEPGRTHTLEIWLGTLLRESERLAPPWGMPAPGADATMSWCAVRLNGRIVWAQQRPLHPADPREASFLRNPIGSTACAPAFTGRVDAWDRRKAR